MNTQGTLMLANVCCTVLLKPFHVSEHSNISAKPLVVLFAALESIRTTKAAQGPPASQLFDILPIHGSLAPGESARTEFSFFAHPGAKVSAVAVCRVEEGPAYQVGSDGRGFQF